MAIETRTVIIKVTNDCNMSCSYCFLHKEAVRGCIISINTIKRVIAELELYSPHETIDMVWHGGEPLLAGMGFFREVVNLQKRSSKKFINSIQTNGTLLTKDMAGLLAELGFSIGISIDGPAAINNAARRYANGSGSFDAIMKAVELLRADRRPFGLIATIARHNIGCPDELYALARDLRAPLKLSPFYCSGRAAESAGQLGITAEEYTRFLSRLAALWISDSSPVEIMNLEAMLGKVLTDNRYSCSCTFSSDCHRKFLAVGPAGDLYPCGMFQGFSEFSYGNIYNMSIAGIPRQAAWERLEQRRSALEGLCSGCSIRRHCNGGCPFHAYAAFGDTNQRDYFCAAYKKAVPDMIDLLQARLEALMQ